MPTTLTCVSCKRPAEIKCPFRIGLVKRCGAPICRDCGHFDDGRAPLHDRLNTDRSQNPTRAEEQAEEMLAVGDLLNDVMNSDGPLIGSRPSKKEVRRAREDLVQLLAELEHPTTVENPAGPTSRED